MFAKKQPALQKAHKSMSEDALQSVQEMLAHQERQINDLSEMVIAQSEEIKALQKQIAKLEGKIETLEDGDGQNEANVKPPHY